MSVTLMPFLGLLGHPTGAGDGPAAAPLLIGQPRCTKVQSQKPSRIRKVRGRPERLATAEMVDVGALVASHGEASARLLRERVAYRSTLISYPPDLPPLA